jgi:molybdenum cofactor cytidylyltransferase
VSTIAAIILAAGRSTRFTGNVSKVVAELSGVPLVRRVANAALGSRAQPVIVVTGHHAGETRAALRGLDIDLVQAADYEAGLAHSLRAGVAAVPPRADGALVLLADMPLISTTLIDRLIDAFDEAESAAAIIPVRAGRRGNPVLIARNLFPALAALEGDRGASRILSDIDGAVELPVADDAIFADVDTRRDLRRLDQP